MNIVILYVISMLVPNIALAITEPYRFTTIIASILLPAGFYLLWVNATRRPGIMILLSLPFIVLCAFQLVLIYMFGGSIIAIDMFTNLFTTTVSEASEVLDNITISIIGVCLLYIPILILAVHSIRIKDRLSKQTRSRMVVAASVMLFVGFCMAATSKINNTNFGIQYHIFPANVVNNIKICVERWDRGSHYLETSKDFTFAPTRTDSISGKEVYILVVGEASRAASWGIFGSERNTTPRLQKTEGLIPFSDLLTQSNTTHKSVPIILAPIDAGTFDNIYKVKSVVTLFKEAGFSTMFISNQGANRSFIDHYADEADTTIRLHNITSGNHYDSEALPYIKEVITKNDGKLFIVFHTYGSHFDFSKRYPKEFAKFTPDHITSVDPKDRQTVQNAYDNSIIYTDHVLSEIIDIMKSDSTSCSAMLYCADHGDDIMDDSRGRFLHASPTTTYYQLHVASFAWFSQPYVDHFPQKFKSAVRNHHSTATTADIFHTMADMAVIESEYVDKTRSLVGSNFVERERQYINDYNKNVYVLNTGLTDLDLKMFDQHKLRYYISLKREERY